MPSLQLPRHAQPDVCRKEESLDLSLVRDERLIPEGNAGATQT